MDSRTQSGAPNEAAFASLGWKQLLAARLQYYRDLGIYDFYRRNAANSLSSSEDAAQTEIVPSSTFVGAPENMFAPPKPEAGVADRAEALRLIQEDLGECTRCVLSRRGRKTIVFGEGNPYAELMFVGEGPGADEDEQGRPCVGRAGHLLNKLIEAMGLKREQE